MTASGAVASGTLFSMLWGSRAGMVRGVSSPEALSAAAEAAVVTRDSVSVEEMFSVSSALERALPLVYQRGALLHPAGQEKALRPASSASTGRRE